MEANVGALMTPEKVKFASASGTNVWAPDEYQYESGTDRRETAREISSSNLVVRNWVISKFANEVVPQVYLTSPVSLTRLQQTPGRL